MILPATRRMVWGSWALLFFWMIFSFQLLPRVSEAANTPFTITLDFNHAQDPLLRWCSIPQQINNNFSNKKWHRPFLVAMLADPQVGWNLNGYNSEALFREAANHLQRLQPDLILIAGDMIQTPMSEEFQELVTAKEILEDLNIPYFLTSGNHDVFQQPSLATLNGFVNFWKTPYYWYGVEYSNTLFLMLETNILLKYKDKDSPQHIQQMAEQQLEWLETTLRTAGNQYQHIIPIAHHPMALQHLEEDDTGLNTPYRVRQVLRQLYQSHPNISHVFGGHIHKKAMVRDDESGINYVTYPATGVVLGRQPSGFALLTIQNSASSSSRLLQEQYYGYDDMPTIRPDLPQAAFEIKYPNGGVEMVVNSQICITWTSTSMANRVQVLFSTNFGASWILIGEGPNVGIYPWTVPASAAGSNEVLVAISSVYDADIIGASQGPNRIVMRQSTQSTVSGPQSSQPMSHNSPQPGGGLPNLPEYQAASNTPPPPIVVQVSSINGAGNEDEDDSERLLDGGSTILAKESHEVSSSASATKGYYLHRFSIASLLPMMIATMTTTTIAMLFWYL